MKTQEICLEDLRLRIVIMGIISYTGFFKVGSIPLTQEQSLQLHKTLDIMVLCSEILWDEDSGCYKEHNNPQDHIALYVSVIRSGKKWDYFG